jgi:hypothetical protein
MTQTPGYRLLRDFHSVYEASIRGIVALQKSCVEDGFPIRSRLFCVTLVCVMWQPALVRPFCSRASHELDPKTRCRTCKGRRHGNPEYFKILLDPFEEAQDMYLMSKRIWSSFCWIPKYRNFSDFKKFRYNVRWSRARKITVCINQGTVCTTLCIKSDVYCFFHIIMSYIDKISRNPWIDVQGKLPDIASISRLILHISV